ncbi:MAG TPA: 50S ribosomal protein L3 [Candidatus Faecicola pullistercoris]|nr:50S ribosomal protein L3 [Candidatus Faecicola pullistercoris]
MNKAIIGKKLGMSQIFAADGKVIPVTVVEAGPCPVTQIKTKDKDGYEAVQVAFGIVKERNVNKPLQGQFKKAGVAPKRYLKELKLNIADYQLGQEIKCTVFSEGDHVDVVGTTKGRGFTGVIQRWNQARGPMAHGSGYHRGVGSMSANSDPSRVFKNKKMPGQYGAEQVTIQNLVVARVDEARNLLLIKGGIPGPRGGMVIIKESIKG